jgi:23S rRNA pseudouridine2605 synthase
MAKKIRLNKYIASCGFGSRRTADEIIISGVVKVNDVIKSTLGTVISENDTVKIKDKIIKPEYKEYIVYNKPPGYLTSTKDPEGRKTIYDILPESIRSLKTAGRLDKDSTGLLIMTNDGELIQQLTHPKMKVPKVYRVMAAGKVKEKDIIKLKKGIEIEESKVAYADALILEYLNNETVLEITLYQGYNRQIRRMLEKIGHPVISLKRTAHACVALGGLERGKFRYMNKKEVQYLKSYLKKINSDID